MSEMRDRVAAAMEKRRAELINFPIARIWPELASAALEIMQNQHLPRPHDCMSIRCGWHRVPMDPPDAVVHICNQPGCKYMPQALTKASR